jgi:hypothetical protein
MFFHRTLKSCIILFFLLLAYSIQGQAKCDNLTRSNCDAFPLSSLLLQNLQNTQLIEFEFDNISEYQAGKTYYGSTLLRLKISDTTNNDCVWKLKMHVTNGGAPLPTQEWETLATYGSSGAKPQLDLIQVRVTNACSSSPLNGSWQTFAAVDNADITIIDNAFSQAAGALYGCSGGETNGEGSYLTNPGEFSFNIDYRIIPGMTKTPGKYEMSIKFCLTE